MFWSPQLSLNNETKFKLLASPQACVGPAGHEFIMGGVAQAAAIEAAEIVADKALLWSTIQFVNAGLLNQSIEIEVELLGGGRSISQVLVTLNCRRYGSSNDVCGTRWTPGNRAPVREHAHGGGTGGVLH